MANFSKIDSAAVRELLSFLVGKQEFCIDVMAVREIRGWTPTTPLPHAPSYVRGVVNLRGTVLPILDLAARLELPINEPTSQHVIIVVELGSQMVGLLVSAVSGILSATDQMIHPTPGVASNLGKEYLSGLLTIEDRMIGLLRTEHLATMLEVEPA